MLSTLYRNLFARPRDKVTDPGTVKNGIEHKAGGPRFLIDVTTSRHYIGRQPVGIVRVEREIANRYFDHEPGSAFVYFDHASRCFRLLSRQFAELVIGKGRAKLDGADDTNTGIHLESELFGERLNYGSRVEFSKDDVIISAGLAWDSEIMGHIFSLKKIIGFRVIQVVHDIVPIIMPEYCVPGMELRFPKFILDAANTADAIFCISESTQSDLTSYLKKIDVRIPHIERIYLGNTLSLSAVAKPPLTEISPLVDGGFVVYVSTLEPRKNHHMLFDLWRELYVEFGELLPTLVFVGRVGWNMDNLLSYIRSCSALFPKHIKLLHDVSDSELIWLYENARFTLYPSLYEGWGLPVVEALSKGKVCIASNRSSIPEASAGYAELIDPFDHAAWRGKITELLRDDLAIKAREQEIQAGFRPLGWDASMQDFQQKVWKVLELQTEAVRG